MYKNTWGWVIPALTWDALKGAPSSYSPSPNKPLLLLAMLGLGE